METKLKCLASVKLPGQVTCVSMLTIDYDTYAAIGHWQDHSITIYSIPQFAVLYSQVMPTTIRSLLLYAIDRKPWLFVGQSDGTVERIQITPLEQFPSLRVGNHPVNITRLDGLYFNSNQDAFLDTSFHRIVKTIFYEQEKDHGTSSRIVSIAKLFDECIYLVEKSNSVGIQVGKIDKQDHVRWMNIHFEYGTFTVEPVQSVFDENYLVIANAISNSVNISDRGLLYIVQYNSQTGGDLKILSTFDFSSRELSNQSQKYSSVHFIVQTNGLNVVGCTYGSISYLEIFSMKHETLVHKNSFALGVNNQHLFHARVYQDRIVILFNNMLHVAKVNDSIELLYRIELLEYDISLESNTPFEYQTFLNQSGSYFRSLFFNIYYFNIFVQDRVYLFVNGLYYGTKVLVLHDSKYEELVDLKHDKLVHSAIMIGNEITCSHTDGTVTKYVIEKVQVEKKKRSYERTGKVYPNQFENGTDLILDQCNGSVPIDDKYIFMRNEQKSSYIVRRLDHVLKQVELFNKERPILFVPGSNVRYVSTNGEIGRLE
jgi:hypothetical protein